MNKVKHFIAPLTVKADGPEGSVRALFSTFDVIDRGKDIVLPTAFTHGQEVAMAAWGHNWGNLPAGKGKVLVEKEGAVFEGRFFLETEAGRQTYDTVKAMGDLQEWSWGFQVLDAGFEERDGEQVRVIKRAEVFEVSPVLIGEGLGTRTLAVKARDWETLLDDEPGLTLAEHEAATLGVVKSVGLRYRSLVDLLGKEGRTLSTARRARITALRDQMQAALAELDSILDETDPDRDEDSGKAASLLARHMQIKNLVRQL